MKERSETILIGGKPLCFRVRRNRRARRFHLTISREDGVVLTMPWRASNAEIPQLMSHWEPWLQEKAEKFGCWNGPRIREYAHGSTLMVLGSMRTLELTNLAGGRTRAQVQLLDDRLVVRVCPQDYLNPMPVLERWLRKLAREEIYDRVDHWSMEMGLFPTKITIGNAKTRWGSCSSRGSISFCYRLVMAHPKVLDSIVVHELCHLRHMNHSPAFYSLLEKYCPDHKLWSQWLTDNSEAMYL